MQCRSLLFVLTMAASASCAPGNNSQTKQPQTTPATTPTQGQAVAFGLISKSANTLTYYGIKEGVISVIAVKRAKNLNLDCSTGNPTVTCPSSADCEGVANEGQTCILDYCICAIQEGEDPMTTTKGSIYAICACSDDSGGSGGGGTNYQGLPILETK